MGFFPPGALDAIDPLKQFPTPERYRRLPRVEAFVDEVGDRGFTTKSSDVFAMVAVMVPQERVPDMKVVVGGLRHAVNTSKPLHWVDHFTPKPKHAARRRLASQWIAKIPDVKVVYVVAHKATLIASQHLRADRDLFYNYMTKLLLERVAYQARYWPGGQRLAVARLSAVKNMDHIESVDYLNGARRYQHTRAPFENILWPPIWRGPDVFDGLQLADLYLGMLWCAIRGDHGDVDCAEMLLEHRHQLRRGPSGQVLGWGVKVFGDPAYLTKRIWWPELIRA
ncbi:DUF3800 domain-containing protein [Cellulosimicrobium sp. ES-005]|uniref:DUF3800 domain-containing protein n=1 Tax=Cellulosimicrobium sp. ES-005 TaxID=3163031 RepID=A0AAU8FZB4_9MICO